ncbi:hypothetical protein P4H42_03855 [Paenibacillus macerans]|uniref:hypothetical protein n=1 Tax=Paenibacillus macerans TaxID=44252 RepID=UPI002DBE3B4E|nr:hypothetical protein [Paenibacillus macerans]MEC0328758.1 hypothetical protein [Paenibacillus macerans]
MVRVGKQLPYNTFAVYVVCTLVEVVSGVSRQEAYDWARRTYGPEAYVMENVQTRDITWEVRR